MTNIIRKSFNENINIDKINDEINDEINEEINEIKDIPKINEIKNLEINKEQNIDNNIDINININIKENEERNYFKENLIILNEDMKNENILKEKKREEKIYSIEQKKLFFK